MTSVTKLYLDRVLDDQVVTSAEDFTDQRESRAAVQDLGRRLDRLASHPARQATHPARPLLVGNRVQIANQRGDELRQVLDDINYRERRAVQPRELHRPLQGLTLPLRHINQRENSFETMHGGVAGLAVGARLKCGQFVLSQLGELFFLRS